MGGGLPCRAMPPKRTIRSNARVENIKALRAAAQQQLRELRSDLKKAALCSGGRRHVDQRCPPVKRTNQDALDKQ